MKPLLQEECHVATMARQVSCYMNGLPNPGNGCKQLRLTPARIVRNGFVYTVVKSNVVTHYKDILKVLEDGSA